MNIAEIITEMVEKFTEVKIRDLQLDFDNDRGEYTSEINGKVSSSIFKISTILADEIISRSRNPYNYK